jgi:hypothetical protein
MSSRQAWPIFYSSIIFPCIHIPTPQAFDVGKVFWGMLGVFIFDVIFVIRTVPSVFAAPFASRARTHFIKACVFVYF